MNAVTRDQAHPLMGHWCNNNDARRRGGEGRRGTVHPAWTGSDQRRRPIGLPCGHRNERPASLCALDPWRWYGRQSLQLNYACNEANETVGPIGRTIISSLFF
jgi:hypothetical protein